MKAARNATEEAQDGALDAFARLSLADFELDNECRQSELDVLGATDKDRSSVPYRACFGERSLGDLVSLRGAKQEDAVKTLVEALLISGHMSESAGNDLVARGYRQVRHLEGGMSAWAAAGYSLDRRDAGP